MNVRLIGCVLAATGVVVSGCSASAHHMSTGAAQQPPAAQVSTAAGTAAGTEASTAALTSGRLVLGPDGLGALTLGASRAQALASGEVSSIEKDVPEGCVGVHLTNGSHDADHFDGYYSEKLGIASIQAPAGVATAQGIRIGSTIAAAERAYPGLTYSGPARMDGGPRIAVPGNPHAFYEFPDSGTGRVTSITLALDTQDCFD